MTYLVLLVSHDRYESISDEWSQEYEQKSTANGGRVQQSAAVCISLVMSAGEPKYWQRHWLA